MGLITVEDIEEAAKKVPGGIKEGDWVLLNTGTHRRWGENDDYFAYSPGLAIEGAKWFVEHHVRGVGFDMQAIDHILLHLRGRPRSWPRMFRVSSKNTKNSSDIPRWKTSLNGSHATIS